MSSRKSKVDLLVRVRYQNPLPPPPFPPKLIAIPTDVTRYTTYDFLRPLAAERELPMVVDADLGMPLELGKNDDGYWTGDTSIICPDADSQPHLDDEDLALLVDPGGGAPLPPGLISHSSPSPGTSLSTPVAALERRKEKVTWLRRTEYIIKDQDQRREKDVVESKLPAALRKPAGPRTKESRLKAIADSFDHVNVPLESWKHPTRSEKRPAAIFPVLPDLDLAANLYHLIRFMENPAEGSRANDFVGPTRLSQAIFRPVAPPDDDARVAFYLLPDDETADALKRRKLSSFEPDPPGAPGYEYQFVRDYEPVTSRNARSEYLLAMSRGPPEGDMQVDGSPSETRPPGAYFATLRSSRNLRKRRPRRGEKVTDYGPLAAAKGVEFWHRIHATVGGRAPLEDLVAPGDAENGFVEE